jgi:uncharacterized peroxidase-related enzyme
MSRISPPEGIEAAPAASQPLLKTVQDRLGRVPNLFRMLAGSPAALQGYLGLAGALSTARISAATRERIALAVAEINGCDYCLSAHTCLGRQAGLDNAEMTANRSGASNGIREDAAVRLAAKIAKLRGHVTDEDVQAFRAEGYSDAELLEVILLVALNTLANYVNEVTGTEIDFPAIHKRTRTQAAA